MTIAVIIINNVSIFIAGLLIGIYGTYKLLERRDQ
jgi:uncharacterized protein YneF (UPF0154 family)